jgi:hypothetical protein
MEHLESQLTATGVHLTDDVLDRIDQIVAPGLTLNPADNGWVSPALDPGRPPPLTGQVPRSTSRAIALTGVPDADAMMIIALRTRTDPCLPRRTICCKRRLLIRKPPRPDRLSHRPSRPRSAITRSSVGARPAACQQTRRTFLVTALVVLC